MVGFIRALEAHEEDDDWRQYWNGLATSVEALEDLRGKSLAGSLDNNNGFVAVFKGNGYKGELPILYDLYTEVKAHEGTDSKSNACLCHCEPSYLVLCGYLYAHVVLVSTATTATAV